jgi:hypothetical protein
VASINRWAAREPMGQMIKAIENELVAIDDRTFRWALRRPYPKMLLALGKSGTPCCFVMPARIAATDPFRQFTGDALPLLSGHCRRGTCELARPSRDWHPRPFRKRQNRPERLAA